MRLNINDRKLKQDPWLTIYRRVKRYCTNSESFLFFEYGARGIKCEFTSSREIKFLWIRDNASKMKEPCLKRKNENKGFSKDNCYFVDEGKWLQVGRDLEMNYNIE